MRGVATAACVAILTTGATAQTGPSAFTPNAPAARQAPASPADSDPAKLGWMVGDPPPPERRIAWADGSFLGFPRTRWSFSHIREFLPTATISRGGGPVRPLSVALRDDLDAVRFTPIGATTQTTWGDSVVANYTDAILVMHRGRIVYERYFGVTTPETQHIAFSATKSYVGALAAALVAEGRLDPAASVAHYLPELADSGFGDATVRQVLDMTTGIAFSEDYADPRSDVAALSLAMGLFPAPPNYAGPRGIHAYLGGIGHRGKHGERFTYRSVNTDVLGWLVARVTGKRLADVLAERIWSRLGAEHDAYMVLDPTGAPFASGGFNATLRDQARFGEMIRLRGRVGDRQVLPEAAVAAIARGGDPARFAPAGYATLPGWSYANQWWVAHNPDGAFMARGIHGQAIYIDPKAEMTIIRFASNPVAGNAAIDPLSLPAYQAIADRLMKGKP